MEDERIYCVYKHTFPNNKIYIGQTRNLEQRWGNQGSHYEQKELSKEISKYGWENIKHEILYDELTKEEALKIEEQEILNNKSYMREYGYNVVVGRKKYNKGEKKKAEKQTISVKINIPKNIYEKIEKLSNYYGENISKVTVTLILENLLNIKFYEFKNEIINNEKENKK